MGVIEELVDSAVRVYMGYLQAKSIGKTVSVRMNGLCACVCVCG